MNEVQKLIEYLKGKAAELEQHAAKDVTAVEHVAARVKDTVEAELAALLGQLHQIPDPPAPGPPQPPAP